MLVTFWVRECARLCCAWHLEACVLRLRLYIPLHLSHLILLRDTTRFLLSQNITKTRHTLCSFLFFFYGEIAFIAPVRARARNHLSSSLFILFFFAPGCHYLLSRFCMDDVQAARTSISFPSGSSLSVCAAL